MTVLINVWRACLYCETEYRGADDATAPHRCFDCGRVMVRHVAAVSPRGVILTVLGQWPAAAFLFTLAVIRIWVTA